MAADPAAETTEDAALGGRLLLRQPRQGHRFGHDAILLAAACSVHAGEHLIDLGAGVGTAGLAVAHRVDNLAVTLVETDSALVTLAGANAARNGLAGRVTAVHLDVGASVAAFAVARLQPGVADHVIMNPPFNAPENPSPHGGRRLAHNAAGDTLASWLKTASRLLRPDGAVTLIWRADALDTVIGGNFGGFWRNRRAADPSEARHARNSCSGSRGQVEPRAILVVAQLFPGRSGGEADCGGRGSVTCRRRLAAWLSVKLCLTLIDPVTRLLNPRAAWLPGVRENKTTRR